ncbi:DUF4286 family protein [Portibacter lacus]|uniref:DUF4286 family protein n=1 Tax=Portibacter lacus TaxID=1099794 RepID=A0AA37SRA2_9BACT|nr:DUF4286 family protein [Portibacter lacus]GLR18632.1 hypothetical protein GCM10007940_32480 [Portibacter lacus]
MADNNILYNVTIKIDHKVEEEWLMWMKEEHIPSVMATQCFIESKINKLLLVPDDDGVMYTIQYECENMRKLQEYQGSHAPKLQKEHQDRYKDKFVAFRSVMEVQAKY